MSCVRGCCAVLCSVLCVVLCSVLCCVLLGGRFWKSIWPLGGSFWPLGGSFWPLGASFWPLGGSFLASWKPLGASWIFWVILGPARRGGGPPLGRFWSPKGSQDEAKFRPKTDQNRCQKRSRKKKALEDRLGAVLGRSWVVLGAVLGSKSCSRSSGARFFENLLFEENEGSRGDLGRSWVDLGRPRGVKMRAAEGQKRSYVEMILSSEVEVKLR